MSIVKVIEVLSESEESWEDATRQALQKAAKTLHGIRSISLITCKPSSKTTGLRNIASTPRFLSY